MEHKHFATRLNVISFSLLLSVFAVTRIHTFAATKYSETINFQLDHSTYCLGDTLRFSATVTNATDSTAAAESHVLYVELLAPEGYVVETRKLKVNGGRCDGSIILRPSLLSGLFEIRAFTRFMVETDAKQYFTQAVPIFEKPGADGKLRMYYRKRTACIGKDKDGFSNRKNGNANSTFAPEKCITVCGHIAPKSKRRQRKQNGNATKGITLVGIYHSTAGDTVYKAVTTDSAGRFRVGLGDITGGTLLLRLADRELAGQFSVVVDKWFGPNPRPFTEAETALVVRSGATLVEPTLPSRQICVVGTTHSTIHTTVADELEYAMAHGLDDVGELPHARGGETLGLLFSMLRRWGYPTEDPNTVRLASVSGTYPGDGEVPECKRIYDGVGFDYWDYDSIVIRTDSTICNAFGYDVRPQYNHMDGSREMGIFSKTGHPHGKPAIVICLIPKRKEACGSIPRPGESDYSITRVEGYSENR